MVQLSTLIIGQAGLHTWKEGVAVRGNRVEGLCKGPFGFEGYINTGIDILNFNSRVFEYRYLNTRRP